VEERGGVRKRVRKEERLRENIELDIFLVQDYVKLKTLDVRVRVIVNGQLAEDVRRGRRRRVVQFMKDFLMLLIQGKIKKLNLY
jgi:hypothetical protein|tara:strand:+ start:661 stop:912 length:252 start_codon:yes stop_codon:yes gene_type:complete